jgi:hypothetical protein
VVIRWQWCTLVAALLVLRPGGVGRRRVYDDVRAVFAHTIYVLGLLAFIPALAPVVRLVVTLVSFVGVWLGAAEAHDLRGWRGLVFPLVFLLVVVVSAAAVAVLSGAAQLTWAALTQELGLSQ